MTSNKNTMNSTNEQTNEVAEPKCDDNSLICPYCDYEHQIEACDYDEHLSFMDCDGCGKEFKYHSEISVTHYTYPITK